MATLFFLVSGENPTLPYSEVKSILDAEGFRYRLLKRMTQVLRIRADQECIKPVKFRSAMTRACGIEIFNCKAKFKTIFNNIDKANLSSFLGDGESFAIRVLRVRGSSIDLDRLWLERKIGNIIVGKEKSAKVKLRTPQKTFLGVLTDDRFVFGLREADIKSGKFIKRGPRRKVFFHSAAMPAKLARCMVNLAQPTSGDLVLDPFCGTGSFLVEAGIMGCRVLGFDVLRSMVMGSQKNLKSYGIEPEGMAVADARSIPLAEASVDCIVTDPPYGTSTTTLGLGARSIFESFLLSVSGFIKKDRLICLAAPKTLRVKEIGERLGFKYLESHFIYIHRSLTREIMVFRR